MASKQNKEAKFYVMDMRAVATSPDDAMVLCAADSIEEARECAKDYGECCIVDSEFNLVEVLN